MSKQQSDYTTREQSKRLLELGVPADSANLFYSKFEGEIFENRPTLCYGRKYSDIVPSAYEKNYLPCWSVGRLMEIYDICHVFSDHNDWCNTQCVNEYVAYIIDCYGRATDNKQLDFSKLEE